MAEELVVIAYRNPAEKAIWEALMSNPGGIFIFMVVMLVAWLVLWFGLTAITGKGTWRGDGGGWIMPVTFIGSFLAACVATFYWG